MWQLFAMCARRQQVQGVLLRADNVEVAGLRKKLTRVCE